VQPQNVPLFQRLFWISLAEVDLHGRPHHLMQVDLSRYAPCYGSATHLVLNARLAA
jgi:hypothetical protein